MKSTKPYPENGTWSAKARKKIMDIRRNPEYHRQESYRLMIQIGLVHSLYGVTILSSGIKDVLKYDHFQAAAILASLHPAIARIVSQLNLLLALTRVRTFCKLQYPKKVHTVAVAVIWLSNILLAAPLVVPCCSARTDEGYYHKKDFSRPFLAISFQIAGYIYQATLCATLILYVAMGMYLIYLKRSFGHVSTTRGELRILLPAFTRFFFDMLLTIMLNYSPLIQTPVVRLCHGLTYMISEILLSPVLYLVLIRPLREEFLLRKRQRAFVQRVDDVHTSHTP
ncbi:hypothetical protein QR680_008019 [Steinernema hermaphroditum]|uniref:7TM GPCR serpentine receptor class x (Srx) domain-containing protein n=1 Tax=Steinernema hermaphroditum TaxID=289476 RepID=A0AA39IH88_9BILA|nr:hypothetical protein QR680_008019 [Steinernema hermaphroditum]